MSTRLSNSAPRYRYGSEPFLPASHPCNMSAIYPPKIDILATFPGLPSRRFRQLSHRVTQRHLYTILVLRISHVLYIPPVIAFWFPNAEPSVLPAVLCDVLFPHCIYFWIPNSLHSSFTVTEGVLWPHKIPGKNMFWKPGVTVSV